MLNKQHNLPITKKITLPVDKWELLYSTIMDTAFDLEVRISKETCSEKKFKLKHQLAEMDLLLMII